ncbi:MAG: methyltransferase [Nitrososphaerales archaeon]
MFPVISIFLFSLAIVIAYLFVSGFIWGAGYYPTPKREIDNAGYLLDPKPGTSIFDLGCGFGKVVVMLAAKYPEANFVGVEVDPLKYLWCKMMINLHHLDNRVRVVRENLLDVDISSASGIFVFLSEETSIMEKLQKKIMKEAKPGIKVVSYVHKFRSWEPSAQKGRARLYEPVKIEGHQ